MEKTIDEFQILINEARAKLSQETREAVDSINWKLIILEMGKKYNENQLETLETETELLLCGIEGPEEYQKELENRMMISKEEVASLLNEMDKLIFKKIQIELEKRIYKNNYNNDKEGSEVTTNKEELIKKNTEDEVPLPPYATTIKNENATSSVEQVVGSSGIESNNKEQVVSVEKEEVTPNINVFEKKLLHPTASVHTVSDYSVKKTDPYREEF